MTPINQLRKWIGLMPSDYSFYKTRDLYLLTFNGYRAGLAASSLRQLKKQAWENYMARVPDVKKQRLPAENIVSDQVAANRAASRKIHVA